VTSHLGKLFQEKIETVSNNGSNNIQILAVTNRKVVQVTNNKTLLHLDWTLYPSTHTSSREIKGIRIVQTQSLLGYNLCCLNMTLTVQDL
jgi:hypothetical protein